MRIVAQATDTASSLSDASEWYVCWSFVIQVLELKDNRNVNLVWFDSKLHNLMLPALPRPNYVNDADEKHYELISVSKVVEKYFEWVGDVSTGERT